MSNTCNSGDLFKTQVDDLVEFKYNGGGHIGQARVVRVKSVGSGFLFGEDVYVDKNSNYRKFKFGKIYEFKILYRRPVAENIVVYDANLGVVMKKKNGDSLSISINPNTIAVSTSKSGGASGLDKHVVVPLPCKNDQLFNALFDILSYATN